MQDGIEPFHVRFIKGRVNLIENCEGRRSALEDGQQQGDRGHCLLSAGEQRDRLRLFSGRPGDDVDAAFEWVDFILKNDIGFSTPE